jgi:hypothetical protein
LTGFAIAGELNSVLNRVISKASVAVLVLAPVLLLRADSIPCPEPDSSRALAPDPTTERIAGLFPGFDHTRELSDHFPHLAIYDSTGAVLGYQLDSDLAGTTVMGFVGPVPVRVFCDTLGLLVGVDLLDNIETPVYFQLVESSDLLDRLLRYRAGTRTRIDAVTLATHSSMAVVQGVVNTVDALFAPPESGEK